jgi:uncharacterized membrane protein
MPEVPPLVAKFAPLVLGVVMLLLEGTSVQVLALFGVSVLVLFASSRWLGLGLVLGMVLLFYVRKLWGAAIAHYGLISLMAGVAALFAALLGGMAIYGSLKSLRQHQSERETDLRDPM